MRTVKFVYWEDNGSWLGYLVDFPDYWTQGETLDDLKEHIRDLHSDLTGGDLPETDKWFGHAQEVGISLSDYLQQIGARETELLGPLSSAQAGNLSDLLLNSPLAETNLDLDRCHDFPCGIDVE